MIKIEPNIGNWKIPEFSEKVFSGYLFQNDEGFMLKLLITSDVKIDYNLSKFDLIIGEIDSDFYSLFSCYRRTYSASSFNGFDDSIIFEISLIFKGKFYFESLDDFKFTQISFKISHSEGWFWPINEAHIEVESDDNNRPISYKYYPKYTNLEFQIEENYLGTLSVIHRTKMSMGNLSVNGYKEFFIESKDNILNDYNQFKKYATYLNWFISIMSNTRCSITELYGYRSDLENKTVQLIDFDYQKKTIGINFIHYKHLEAKFSQVLENWYKLCKILPIELEMLYNCLILRPRIEQNFKDTYSILEGIYRWKFKKDNNETFINEIIKNLEFNHKDELPYLIKKLTNQDKKWPKRAVNIRNFLSHLNHQKYKDLKFNDSELFALKRRLEAIILYYIFHFIGIENEIIDNSFQSLGEKYFNPQIF